MYRVDVFNKEVRSVLEFASVGLTQDNIIKIERVDKSAFAIILEKNYISYFNSLKTLNMKTLNMKTLAKQREDLTLKFAQKATEHQRHKYWFSLNTKKIHQNNRT